MEYLDVETVKKKWNDSAYELVGWDGKKSHHGSWLNGVCKKARGDQGMEFGIVLWPAASIYERPAETKETEGVTVSAISDEVLSGMGLAVTGEEVKGFLPIRTFYGYVGYVKKEAVRLVSLKEMQFWEMGGLRVTLGLCLDVQSLKGVRGIRCSSLCRGSLVRVITSGKEEEGWLEVEMADQRRGFVRREYLAAKEFSQEGLWSGGLPQREIVDEEEFRKAVVETALTYLGVQYRWGCRSSLGLDCSGLVSESYLLNGILIYRDAKMADGFPVHPIEPDQARRGDLLYFPGHIALYAGDGKYVHSTGKDGESGVVVNSLNPEDDDYRVDLAQALYAVGSIF